MTTDSSKTILHSALRFCSGTFFSRLSGFARDFTMAYLYGTNEKVALFFVAYRLSYLCRRLFSDGAMQSAFIPLFEEKRKHDGEEAALNFFSTLKRSMTAILLLFIGVSTTILLCLPRFSSDIAEIITLTIMMLPSLLFLTLYGVNAAYMQCEKRFFLPASAPALFNLVWIGGAILCRDLELEEAIRRLALTMNLGCFAQWLITIPYTWGAGKGSWKFWSADIKRLVQKMSLGFTGVAAIQVNNAIDPFFALAADTEGPNYLWYAIRLKQVPLALFGIAISSALLPPLSRAIQSGATAKFRHFFHEAISKCSFLMIPITFFTLLAPIPIIDAVFGYGEFDGRAVNETATVLVCYMIGLLPATFILIQAQVFFALGDFRTPAKGALLAMCTNSVLNYLLIFSFGWGPASVALATSISSLLNGLYLYNKLPVDKPSMVPPLFHAATASAFAALTTGWISQSIILPEQSILLVATLGLTFSCLYLASATLINRLIKPASQELPEEIT